MTKSRKPKAITLMTPSDASRIQRAAALVNGGKVEKGSFPAIAQKAAAKNERKLDQ
jgi:hypothetical protein